jgi:hypothetical protein
MRMDVRKPFTTYNINEQDQQLHPLLSGCNNPIKIFRRRASQQLRNCCAVPLEESHIDFRDYLPSSDDKARFIEECERIKRDKTPVARGQDNGDDDYKNNKKTKFAKSTKSATKVARNQLQRTVLSTARIARPTHP